MAFRLLGSVLAGELLWDGGGSRTVSSLDLLCSTRLRLLGSSQIAGTSVGTSAGTSAGTSQGSRPSQRGRQSGAETETETHPSPYREDTSCCSQYRSNISRDRRSPPGVACGTCSSQVLRLEKEKQEEVALPVVWRGAGGTGAWQPGDGGHDLSQGASL